MYSFRLKVFCSVAHNLSFTKAAQELHITQPAVSRHIQELEQELGVQLFNRYATSIEITEAGELLLLHATQISECYRALDFDMRLLDRHHAGELRLGATPVMAQYVLPACMASFATKFKQIRLSLVEGNSQEIEEAVAEGRVDLGLVECVTRRPTLRYTPIVQDELLLVAPMRGRWASLDVVTLDQLATMPLVLGYEGADVNRCVEQLFAARQIPLATLNVVMRLGSDEAMKRYIVHADSLAFVSERAFVRDLRAGEYKVIEIEGVSTIRQCAFVRTMSATKDVVKDFIDYVQEWLARGEY